MNALIYSGITQAISNLTSEETVFDFPLPLRNRDKWNVLLS